jgi:peptidoglycan-associated lipoprotein
MRNFWTLFLCCALLPLVATAQNTSSGTGNQTSNPWKSPYTYKGDKTTAIAAPIEISVDYSYLRANQGPGQCGCFNMNGGSAEVAFHTYRWFSAVADLTGERSGTVNGGPQGLSLVSFTAGPRFTYPIHHRYAPFAQGLFGGVHGFDTYFPVTSGSTGAASSFAMLAGGGLDLRMKSWLAIRPAQADYFYTQLPNGVNNRQNNLRLSAGVVFPLW